MSGLVLLDKSAFVRGLAGEPDEAERCVCDVTALEILSSARSAADYRKLEADLAALRWLRVDAQTMATARSAQRELAARGKHRIPIPDLIIAACAQQHGADVLHLDRHYDALAEVLAFEPIRALRS